MPKCTNCLKEMDEWFEIDGHERFCSRPCLYTTYTSAEFTVMYIRGIAKWTYLDENGERVED